MPLILSGSAGLSGNVGTTTKEMLPAGSVLQVVQAVKTDTFATTVGQSTPALISGLTASITPYSVSSKVLVTVNIGEIGASGDSTWAAVLYRNGVPLCLGDAASGLSRATIAGGIPSGGGTWRGNPGSISFLDSPASTTPVTYTVGIGGNGAITITVNYDSRNGPGANDSSRTASTIVLTEIKG